MLREAGDALEPDDPVLFDRYFRMLYLAENQDVKGIQTLRQEFNFATIGREFRLIEDGFTRTVVVPHGAAEERLSVLRRDGPTVETRRSLQPFTVSIYPDAFQKLVSAGALEELQPGLYCITRPFAKQYDPIFGLVVGDEVEADPEALVV